MTSEATVAEALKKFDAINAEDPNIISVEGVDTPKELFLARALERWVYRVEENPSIPLRLAARSQHLGRYLLPRSAFPEGRIGYLSWRKEQGRVQCERAVHLLRELGFENEVLEPFAAIVQKQGLKTNSDVQAMEDALCLSFLENEFAPFIDKYDDDKVIDIVQKTWRKMSPRGHELALTLPLEGRAKELVLRALGGS